MIFQTPSGEIIANSPIQPLQQNYISQIIESNERFEGEVLSRRVRDKLAAKEAKKG